MTTTARSEPCSDLHYFYIRTVPSSKTALPRYIVGTYHTAKQRKIKKLSELLNPGTRCGCARCNPSTASYPAGYQ